MAGLHAIPAVLEDPMLKLKQAKDIRWLSYEAAISFILRQWRFQRGDLHMHLCAQKI